MATSTAPCASSSAPTRWGSSMPTHASRCGRTSTVARRAGQSSPRSRRWPTCCVASIPTGSPTRPRRHRTWARRSYAGSVCRLRIGTPRNTHRRHGGGPGSCRPLRRCWRASSVWVSVRWWTAVTSRATCRWSPHVGDRDPARGRGTGRRRVVPGRHQPGRWHGGAGGNLHRHRRGQDALQPQRGPAPGPGDRLRRDRIRRPDRPHVDV